MLDGRYGIFDWTIPAAMRLKQLLQRQLEINAIN